MSDLPSREVANIWAQRLRHSQYDFVPKLSAVVQAYADGTLMTRQELIDNLDWDAMYESESQSRHDMPFSMLTSGYQTIVRDNVRNLLMAALVKDTT